MAKQLEVKVGGSIDTIKVKGEMGTPVIVGNEPREQRKDPDVRFVSSDEAYIDTNIDGNLVVGRNLYVDGEITSSEGSFEPLPDTTGKVGKVLKVDTDGKAKWLDDSGIPVGDVVITGNLEVQGDTLSVGAVNLSGTENLYVDKDIYMNEEKVATESYVDNLVISAINGSY